MVCCAHGFFEGNDEIGVIFFINQLMEKVLRMVRSEGAIIVTSVVGLVYGTVKDLSKRH